MSYEYQKIQIPQVDGLKDELGSAVKSVNNITPDPSGNVNVPQQNMDLAAIWAIVLGG